MSSIHNNGSTPHLPVKQTPTEENPLLDNEATSKIGDSNSETASETSSDSSVHNGRSYSHIPSEEKSSPVQKTENSFPVQATKDSFTAADVGASGRRSRTVGLGRTILSGGAFVITNAAYYLTGYAAVKSILSSANKTIKNAAISFGFTKEADSVTKAKGDLKKLASQDADNLHNSLIGKGEPRIFEENISSSELIDVIDTAKAASLTSSKMCKDKPLSKEAKQYLNDEVQSILTKAGEGKISPEKAISKLKEAYSVTAFTHLENSGEVKPKSIEKKFEEFKKDFESKFFESAGEFFPKTSIRNFSVNGQKFTEQLEIINCDTGAEYLSQVQGDDQEHQEQIDFINRSADKSTNASRPSGMKKEIRAQGMAINANKHTVTNQSGKSRTIIRAGAPAIHGQGKIGLTNLKKKLADIKNMPPSLQKEELGKIKGKLKIESKEDLTLNNLESIVKKRTQLITAQALPTLLASLEDIAQDPKALQMAQATGSFLHIERSNVSDLDPSEAVMMEDMKGAMDELSKNVRIVFSDDAPEKQLQVDKETGQITITLKSPEGQSSPKEGYGLTAVMVNMGINEKQSTGMVRYGEATRQNEINAEAFSTIKEYADTVQNSDNTSVSSEVKESAGKVSSSLEAVKNKTHYAKDLELMDVISDAASDLHAGLVARCKSGKDRTSADTNRTMGRTFSNKETGVTTSDFKSAMSGGLSYEVTGRNTQKGRGYAFNSFQAGTMPEEYRVNSEHHASSGVSS
jgi:hypothetical protein